MAANASESFQLHDRVAVVIGEVRHDLGEVKVPATDVELRLPE